MRFNTSRRRAISICGLTLIAFFVVLHFQACSQSSSKVVFGSLGGKANGLGRGDGYDGKPQDGSYYRVVPDTRCGSALALFGQIDIKGESIKARFLDVADCTKKERELRIGQLESNSYVPELLGFEEGVFEKKGEAPDLTQRDAMIPEVWCRTLDSTQTRGVDVIVLGRPATGEIRPQIIVNSVEASSRLVPTNAARKVSEKTVQYMGDGFSLRLDVPSPVNSGVKLTGQLKVSADGQEFDQPVTCRLAGSLDIQSEVAPLTCPAGYIPVPALAGYTQSDFCVAKYEGKQVGSLAVSQATGTPWVNIDRASALTACQANGVQYDLISNDEWQSVARNIESVAANWSGGLVGSVGGLNTGHSDNDPSTPLAASPDDNQSCFGTLQSCDLGIWDSQRRTFQLGNGGVLWDLAGNVIEWVKDDLLLDYGPRNPIALITNAAPYANQAKDKFGPAGDYSSLTAEPYGGLGLFEAGTGGALVRGGVWYWGPDAGIFEATMTVATDSTQGQLGFRCVYRP